MYPRLRGKKVFLKQSSLPTILAEGDAGFLPPGAAEIMPECHAGDRAAERREFAVQPIMQRPGLGRGHLVLNGDVWAPPLFVLRSQVFMPKGGEFGAKSGGFWRMQRVGNAAAQETQAGDVEGGWGLLGA